MPPIVINSTFRGGQSNSFIVPLQRNSVYCPSYNGKNALATTMYPISTIYKPRSESTNRALIRHGALEQNGSNERVFSSSAAKNNLMSPSRPGHSPKPIAFAPGFYCKKIEKHKPGTSEQPKFGNSFSKSSSGNIKYHTDKGRFGAGAEPLSSGIIGTVLTANGPSKLTYYQPRDLTVEWPLHSNYKQQRRVCSALASKRKVPGVISWLHPRCKKIINRCKLELHFFATNSCLSCCKSKSCSLYFCLAAISCR